MTQFKLILIGGLITASAVISVGIHHRGQVQLGEVDNGLQQQTDRIAQLTTENQRLSNALAQATSEAVSQTTEGKATELVKLRTEVRALQKQIDESSQQAATNHPTHSSQAAAPPVQHPPEYWDQLHQMAGTKIKDAMILGVALAEYASDHNGQYPSSPDQVNRYLQKDKDETLSGTNEFDIVYQGSSARVKNIPMSEVAVVRDRQTWPGPDGKMTRIYGMMNGMGMIVQADDNFQAWEAEHIIAPPNGNP